MNRWGKAVLIVNLGLAVGACTAAPKKVATTSPVTSSSPAPAPVINVQPTVIPASTRTIAALGTGTVTVQPDTVIGSLGVAVQRSTLAAASGKLASLVASVKRVVAAGGGRSADVSITGSSLYPTTPTSFQVAEIIQVRLPNNDAAMRLFATIGATLGSYLQGGINTTLVSSDEDPFYAQARKAAIADAKEAAAAWAALAGVSLGRLQSVSEIAPVAANGATGLGGGYGYGTPSDGSVTINKGAFTYTVRVSVVYEVK
jgi:uncharacterized protein